MTELKYTEENVELVQEFINETKRRFMGGQNLVFTSKAVIELEKLEEDFDVSINDICNTILNLNVQDYYRGIDESTISGDYNVCAFCDFFYNKNVEIYLKYGLQKDGLNILVFSNHKPNFPIRRPFKI